MLGLEAEQRLIGHGLSTCATCDGFFFRGHEIAVVGGGDSAIEEATFLTKFADKVTIIHRRDELRASKIMQDRALANPKIEFLWNSRVTEIFGETSVSGVEVTNTVDGSVSTLPVTGLFVAIGHRPNTDLFIDQLDLDPTTGYLVTKHDSSYTDVDGVFACGDVQDDVYRQAITAAGSGCMAAIDAERWLEANVHH
jgi:thioredoxin reductase (NADPH)